MQKIIIKTGRTYPALAEKLGDFEHWITREMQAAPDEWRVVDVQRGETLPAVEDCAAAVITGSPAMVSDREDWSVSTAQWLRQAVARELPVLGICYGHQLLADALGGSVGYHPKGPEAGVVEVDLLPAAAEDPLFAGMPASFPAAVIHWQSVSALPPGAVRLAANAFEPNHAFRLGSAWGVQFHPEFDLAAMGAYLAHLATTLQAAGLAPETLRTRLCPTPQAAAVLQRFARLLQQPSV
ncbi:glutamine amidotransferase [Aquitalea magnusonii]|nr:glutamine amidotransferase [Aquitalea magnusonii]